MQDNAVEITLEHGPHKGIFEINIGEWEGHSIAFDFKDHIYDNEGRIRFDGASGEVSIDARKAYDRKIRDPRERTAYFERIVGSFANNYRFGWSPDGVIAYDQSYHVENNYAAGNEKEVAIKRVQAGIVNSLVNPRKCLVAGCSNGELVRRCRELGMDTWGFDLIPELESVAFEEARPFVRTGSLTNIPYGPEDRFDTLVAIDVLEHVPERDIPKVIEEWKRIEIRYLVLLINLRQFWYPGHVTLRPLSWWAEQWNSSYEHVKTLRSAEHLPAVYSNDGRYDQQWTLWRSIY